jgi:hypothetical protein
LEKLGARVAYVHCDTSDEGELKALMKATAQEFDAWTCSSTTPGSVS